MRCPLVLAEVSEQELQGWIRRALLVGEMNQCWVEE